MMRERESLDTCSRQQCGWLVGTMIFVCTACVLALGSGLGFGHRRNQQQRNNLRVRSLERPHSQMFGHDRLVLGVDKVTLRGLLK